YQTSAARSTRNELLPRCRLRQRRRPRGGDVLLPRPAQRLLRLAHTEDLRLARQAESAARGGVRQPGMSRVQLAIERSDVGIARHQAHESGTGLESVVWIQNLSGRPEVRIRIAVMIIKEVEEVQVTLERFAILRIVCFQLRRFIGTV